MLSERQLERLLRQFEERMQAVTEEYLQRMGQHIRDIGTLTASDVNRLVELKRLNTNLEYIKRRIAKAAGLSVRDIERLFKAIAEDDYRFAASAFAEDHTPPVKTNRHLTRIIKAQLRITAQAFKNLSQTTIVSEGYRNAVDTAVQTVQAGLTDYQSAIRKAFKAAARDGLRVEYPNSGMTRRLDTAVRQNVLDGVRSINQDVLNQVGKEFGADGIEISAHALCALDHLPYQGRQLKKKDFDRLQNTLQRPFGMWNCKHTMSPVIIGVSQPTYSESELAMFAKNSTESITIDGRTMSRYEWSQHQRRLETAVRYQKDIAVAAKAAGDMPLRREAQARINRINAEYDKISQAAGLTPRRDLMRVSGFSAVKAVDQLKNPPKTDIITKTSSLIRSSTTNKTINPEKQNRHILDADEYAAGRSYVYGDLNTAQVLVNDYHGTGTPMFDKNGNWKNKEVVKASSDIGVNVDARNRTQQPTNRFVIHYSKTGTHIVPTKREE